MKIYQALIILAALALLSAGSLMAEVSVTVYNSNLGVVKEARLLSFEKGLGRISFTDVPSQIDPTSVGFELEDKEKSVSILEQNYAYDLVSPEKIYSKYIDKDIDIIDKTGQVFSGTLLSFSGGSAVLREKSGKIQIIQMSQIVNVNFPELPEGLITRPTLFWLYSSGFKGEAECNVSYQTGGLGWSAEYVGILSEDEKNLGWNGWSSITNNSGAAYRDATMKLVAGDINRVRKSRGPDRPEFDEMVTMSAAKGIAFEEKEFFEYHLYTLPRKTTIADNEIKQIALFDPSSTAVGKEYYYEPDKNEKKVRVVLKFNNSEKSGLGIPLPAGRARIFKADTDGSMILLGEDNIEHTAKEEDIKLTIGYAFDIAAEQKITSYDRISDRVEERTFSMELRNHKKENISILVEKSLFGDWEIVNKDFDFTKKDANTVQFLIPVASNGKAVLTFTVRFGR
jgi:hypothetical protein